MQVKPSNVRWIFIWTNTIKAPKINSVALKIRILEIFGKSWTVLKKTKDNENIDMETLYDFFKTLNEIHENEDTPQDLNIDLTNDDELLNSPITEGEIRKCIKMLKKKKFFSWQNH